MSLSHFPYKMGMLIKIPAHKNHSLLSSSMSSIEFYVRFYKLLSLDELHYQRSRKNLFQCLESDFETIV